MISQTNIAVNIYTAEGMLRIYLVLPGALML